MDVSLSELQVLVMDRDAACCDSWGRTESDTVADFIFWAPKALQMVITAMKLKDAYSFKGKL